MLGLLVVPGFVVAPTLFSIAASRSMAGHLAGEIFHVSNLAILILVLVLAGFWVNRKVSGWIWCLLVTVAALVAINEFGIARQIAELKLKMGPIDLVPKEDPLHRSFALWHGISAIIHLVSVVAAAILVATGTTGREELCKSS